MLAEVIRDGTAIGNMHDDYCKDTTQEEVQAVLKHMAHITYSEVMRNMAEEAAGQNQNCKGIHKKIM